VTTFKPTLRQRAKLLVTGHPIHALSAVVPSFTYYGGATVTRAHDANGALWTVCCAKDNASGAFGLYVLNGAIPILIRPVSGRGSVWISLFNGHAYWVGFDGNQAPLGDLIPGFAPFPSLPSLKAEIAALAEVIAKLPPTTTGATVRVPAQGGLEGGEIQLDDGAGGVWAIDGRAGNLRFVHNGAVYKRWPE
jgi:hypothetical protein